MGCGIVVTKQYNMYLFKQALSKKTKASYSVNLVRGPHEGKVD